MRRQSIAAAGLALAIVAALLATHGSSAQAQPVASITLPDPGGTEQLYPGCNNIGLTFPDGTASDTVVQAVSPASAVQAMWRHDAAQNSFEGFSPAAPQASDLLTVNFLDAVWICVTAPVAEPSPTPEPTSTPPPGPPTPFTVHFIDVGQGDAALIEVGDVDILVDGGPRDSGLLTYLAAQDVPDIDLLVLTHPHLDHFGGLPGVLAQYDVQELWTNGVEGSGPKHQPFATAVTAEGLTAQAIMRGHSAQFDGVTLTALHPTSSLSSDANTNSLVLRISCGSVDVLLTGDATKNSEASMVADASVTLDAEVLKVGHHGSKTSTTDAFLDAVTPGDAVISVGAGNTYGHPTQEALNRLAAHGATVHRTDVDGTVVLTSDCSSYSLSTAGAPPPPPPTATPTPPTIATPLPTATLAPPTPTPSGGIDCSIDQYNCGDFSTCAEVMAVFNACPGDPNRLDGDKDGVPCESLCG